MTLRATINAALVLEQHMRRPEATHEQHIGIVLFLHFLYNTIVSFGGNFLI